MSTVDFIHDPMGLIVFDEPTTLEMSQGNAQVRATVLPFSGTLENRVYAGQDTYIIPNDATYTVLTDLDINDIDEIANSEDGSELSLAELLTSTTDPASDTEPESTTQTRPQFAYGGKTVAGVSSPIAQFEHAEKYPDQLLEELSLRYDKLARVSTFTPSPNSGTIETPLESGVLTYGEAALVWDSLIESLADRAAFEQAHDNSTARLLSVAKKINQSVFEK